MDSIVVITKLSTSVTLSRAAAMVSGWDRSMARPRVFPPISFAAASARDKWRFPDYLAWLRARGWE
jgi:hypothetical protein